MTKYMNYTRSSRNLTNSSVSPFRDRVGGNIVERFDSEFIQILTERRQYFLNYLYSRLGDWVEAEDVLQDFHIRALTKSDQIRHKGATLSWLRMVLHSVLTDHFRRKAVERRSHELMAVDVETAVAGPEREFDRPNCTCFYRLLPTLKAEYAEALSRVDLAEQCPAEVAHDLGISRGNLRIRLHRGRKALREALRHSCHQCHEYQCFGDSICLVGV